MGIQAMIHAIKNNRLQMRERKTMYDYKADERIGVYGKMIDHRRMKSHEYAEFQKEQFRRKKVEKKQRRIHNIIVVGITIAILIVFLLIWNQFDPNTWNSPQFK